MLDHLGQGGELIAVTVGVSFVLAWRRRSVRPILFARRLLCWLPGPLVVVGTTHVAYHWLTDSVGGFLLGLLVIRQLARIPWATLPLPAPLDGRHAEERPSAV